MQQSEQKPAADDGEQDGHEAGFAAHCTACLRELRQTRSAAHDASSLARLAWHRTRLGVLMTADAELDKRIAAIGADRRWLDPADVRSARVDALIHDLAPGS